MRQLCACVALGIAVLVMSVSVSEAAPTPEQRKELSAIQKEVASVSSMIRRKEYEEAEKKLEELNSQARKLIEDAQFPPTDRSVTTDEAADEQSATSGQGSRQTRSDADQLFRRDRSDPCRQMWQLPRERQPSRPPGPHLVRNDETRRAERSLAGPQPGSAKSVDAASCYSGCASSNAQKRDPA